MSIFLLFTIFVLFVQTYVLYLYFSSTKQHWTEFIYLPSIRKLQRLKAEQWARKCCRLKVTKHLLSPLQPKPKETPIQRIKSHLCSYDKKLCAPKYVKPKTKLQKDINGSTIKLFKNNMQTLWSTATYV